jgi:hypothetical protein
VSAKKQKKTTERGRLITVVERLRIFAAEAKCKNIDNNSNQNVSFIEYL